MANWLETRISFDHNFCLFIIGLLLALYLSQLQSRRFASFVLYHLVIA